MSSNTGNNCDLSRDLREIKISEHFTVHEAVHSQTALRQGINNMPGFEELGAITIVATHILEPVRTHFGIPFSPSSWYRSGELNRAIGSSDTSQHIKGQAVDFEVPGISNFEVAKYIQDNLEFDQLILEFWSHRNLNAGWIHCSYVASPLENRKEVLRFDGRSYLPGLIP